MNVASVKLQVSRLQCMEDYIARENSSTPRCIRRRGLSSLWQWGNFFSFFVSTWMYTTSKEYDLSHNLKYVNYVDYLRWWTTKVIRSLSLRTMRRCPTTIFISSWAPPSTTESSCLDIWRRFLMTADIPKWAMWYHSVVDSCKKNNNLTVDYILDQRMNFLFDGAGFRSWYQCFSFKCTLINKRTFYLETAFVSNWFHNPRSDLFHIIRTMTFYHGCIQFELLYR